MAEAVLPSPQPECRLCLDAEVDAAEGEDGLLVYPCLCASPLHVACLRKWQAAQVERAVEEMRSLDEALARAWTCEVCGAQLVLHGQRARPFSGTATCRAQGGFGKVALRRVPTLSRSNRNFSEFAVSDGQDLEVLEQDATGEFFRVRALKAPRYREEGTVAVAEGWIRSAYLEWPVASQHLVADAVPAPRMPPAYSRDIEAAAAVANEAPQAQGLAEEGDRGEDGASEENRNETRDGGEAQDAEAGEEEDEEGIAS